ncbi:MAG: phage holin family protein [Hylemonella sp.]|nr:phage holin family protein [Hylemonella sp.]
MSEPVQGPGLLGSLRQLMGTVLETAQLRLALLSNEVEQEKLRLFDGLLWAGLGLLLLGLGALLLCAFVVVLFWDSHRLLALGTLALLFLGAGGWLLAQARARLQSRGGPFKSSVAELGRDRAGLDTGE